MRILRYQGEDNALHQQAEPITEFNSDLQTLVKDMFETLKKEKGIGLAAPQVGVSKRLIIVDVSKYIKTTRPMALINPFITEMSLAKIGISEGCLSLPGVNYKVDRSARIKLTALSPLGGAIKIEAEGLLSIVLQHEIDHLQGILLVDYMTDPTV
jgi:peptide deformylase